LVYMSLTLHETSQKERKREKKESMRIIGENWVSYQANLSLNLLICRIRTAYS